MAPHMFATETKCDCMHRLMLIGDFQHIANTMKCNFPLFTDLKASNTLKKSSDAPQTHKVASVKFGWPCQPQQSLSRCSRTLTTHGPLKLICEPVDCMRCLTSSKHELCYCDLSAKLDQRHVHRFKTCSRFKFCSSCNLVLHSKGHVDGAVNLQHAMQ